MSNIKHVIVKGGIPVDEGCNAQAHVFVENVTIYDACLNQTDIEKNSNKFYNIQLLESDSGGIYYVWSRYGRNGERGKGTLTEHRNDLSSARMDFQKKFKDKTKNDWLSKGAFKSYVGKYTLIERNFQVNIEEPIGSEIVESKLDIKVQNLVKLICDTKMMKRQMIEIGYDADKMPLGKLSKEHIAKGYNVLQRLSDVIDKGEGLAELSSEFYTLIPHSFGRMIPPIINTAEKVKEKIEMLASLQEVVLATKLLEGNNSSIDDDYNKLRCEIKPLDHNSPDFKMIQKYIKQTHGNTHNRYSLDIEDVFELNRSGEKESFSVFENMDNRQLLFHGSRLTNFTGILSQGLKIAPPEAPASGYMYDKGIYFADVVSKSANYCNTSPENNTACILLCEVALGEMNELTDFDYNASKLPKGKLSVKGCGRNIPNPDESVKCSNNTIVPLGNIQKINIDTTLHYNEYIVYNTAQIQMKYLLKLKFNYK